MESREGMATPPSQDTKCVYVLSDIDGYKYKLVMQGDVGLLSVRTIKRYLAKAAGIDVQHQQISFNGDVLGDSTRGREIGLFNGAILRLKQTVLEAAPSLASSAVCDAAACEPARRSTTHTIPVYDGASTSRSTSFPSATSPSPANSAGLRFSDRGAAITMEDSTEVAGWSSSARQPQHSMELMQHNSSHVSTAAPSPVSDTEASRHSELERRVAHLSMENVRLREQLQVVAQQAAASSSDWKLEEELAKLKNDLAAAVRAKADVERSAAVKWQVKEEELAKELDLLREERRRMQRDAVGSEERHVGLLHRLEGEIRGLKNELRDKEEAMQTLRYSLAELQSREDPRAGSEIRPPRSPCFLPSLDEMVESSLTALSKALNTPQILELDPSTNTCVVPISADLNVLVTLDVETHRLYLYATLLNFLPTSSALRLQLYEALLQGSLLGKDMAGGSVGISTDSGLILMSTSVDLHYSDASALAAAASPFVDAAKGWVSAVHRIVNHDVMQ